jgi:hypothetical protein
MSSSHTCSERLLEKKTESIPKKENQKITSLNINKSVSQEKGKLPNIIERVFETPSQSLDSNVQALFEPLFKYDFSMVKVYDDNLAAQSAKAIGAKAYTFGDRIVFDSGMYKPTNFEGQRLLAHELAHVVQQGKGGRKPDLDLSAPYELDARAASLNFQTGASINVNESTCIGLVRDANAPSSSQPLNLGQYSSVLNNENHKSPNYQKALQAWPDSEQIWKYLNSRTSRQEFIRYLLEIDLTSCRPYDDSLRAGGGQECKDYPRKNEVFANLCQGFATQLNLNLRDKPTPEAAVIEQLKASGIYYQPVTPKFRIPILIATSIGHAFNAIQIENNPAKIESYLFIEPQTDEMFDSNSPTFKNNFYYFGYGALSLSEWRGPLYQQKTKEVFARTASGQGVKADVKGEEGRVYLKRIVAAVFIAEDFDTFNTTISKGNTTYEEHVNKSVADIDDSYLLSAARYIIGRSFKRKPNGKEEILTVDVFIKLINRDALREKLLSQQQIKKPNN